MTTTEPPAAVPVIQADREAAAHLFPTFAPSILSGEMDETENVQAFARHRLAATPTPPSTEAQGEGWNQTRYGHPVPDLHVWCWHRLWERGVTRGYWHSEQDCWHLIDDDNQWFGPGIEPTHWTRDWLGPKPAPPVLARHRQQSSASGVGEDYRAGSANFSLLQGDNARMVQALQAVRAAMLQGGDGAVGDYGWNITALNKARPLVRDALESKKPFLATRSTAGQPDGALREAFQTFLDHVEADECRHEDTCRGGAIWTICRDCDRRWADDQGGFPGYVEPKHIAAARAALAANVQPEVE